MAVPTSRNSGQVPASVSLIFPLPPPDLFDVTRDVRASLAIQGAAGITPTAVIDAENGFFLLKFPEDVEQHDNTGVNAVIDVAQPARVQSMQLRCFRFDLHNSDLSGLSSRWSKMRFLLGNLQDQRRRGAKRARVPQDAQLHGIRYSCWRSRRRPGTGRIGLGT